MKGDTLSEFPSRDLLMAAGAFAAGVTVVLKETRRGEGGDPNFMNNVSEASVTEPLKNSLDPMGPRDCNMNPTLLQYKRRGQEAV